MNECIKNTTICVGRDSRELSTRICCLEEIEAEQEIALNIVDTIDDCRRDKDSLLRVSSRLSYGAHVINDNGEEARLAVLPIIKRFSQLLYEFQDKILQDKTVGDLIYSFAHELQRWFSYHFLETSSTIQHPVQHQSISADINTIEIALGVCMILTADDASLDDLFF